MHFLLHISPYGLDCPVMETKQKRHRRLAELVGEQAIRSQKALLEALARSGLGVDQSTLSRDLRELGIRKVRGRYRRIGGLETETPVLPQVLRYTTCGPNLAVIHTEVGQAQPVGVLLDSADEPAIEATIAGDDTVFVATKGRRQQEVLLRRLASWFGEERHDR